MLISGHSESDFCWDKFWKITQSLYEYRYTYIRKPIPNDYINRILLSLNWLFWLKRLENSFELDSSDFFATCGWHHVQDLSTVIWAFVYQSMCNFKKNLTPQSIVLSLLYSALKNKLSNINLKLVWFFIMNYTAILLP